MAGSLKVSDVEELRGKPFHQKAIPLPNLSVLVLYADRQGAIRLTVLKKGATLGKEVLEGGRVGSENDPKA